MVRLLALLLFAFPVFADTANGTFTPPTTREDGTALTPAEIGGYNVYLNGTQQQTLPGDATAFSITLDIGTHTINLTTLDTDGRESVLSDPAVVVIPGKPSAPTSITITITIE